jgi:hypothetical protein
VTDRPRPRPRIVVMVGMGRSGSTTLYHQLRRHPGAALPFRKETFYFSAHYDRGVDWFLDLFRDAAPGQIGFDISPEYFLNEAAIGRILDFDPDTKAILSVREPVAWTLSMYNQRSGSQVQIPPFAEFIHDYDLQVAGKTTHVRFSSNLVTRMVDLYRAAFGDNLLLWDFDYFAKRPLEVCQAIEAFAGLPSYFTERTFENVVLNASNRRHNTRLYAFLNDERVISFLHRVVPESMLSKAREAYYLAVRQDAPSDPAQRHPEENVRLAEEVFGEERAEIRRLFAEHPIQYGSGAPFRHPATEAATTK